MKKKKYNRFGYSRDLKVILVQISSFMLCILMVGVGLAISNFPIISWLYMVIVYIMLPILFLKCPKKIEKISGFIYFLLIVISFASFNFPKVIRDNFGVYGTWAVFGIYGYLVKRKHEKLLEEIYEKE